MTNDTPSSSIATSVAQVQAEHTGALKTVDHTIKQLGQTLVPNDEASLIRNMQGVLASARSLGLERLEHFLNVSTQRDDAGAILREHFGKFAPGFLGALPLDRNFDLATLSAILESARKIALSPLANPDFNEKQLGQRAERIKNTGEIMEAVRNAPSPAVAVHIGTAYSAVTVIMDGFRRTAPAVAAQRLIKATVHSDFLVRRPVLDKLETKVRNEVFLFILLPLIDRETILLHSKLLRSDRPDIVQRPEGRYVPCHSLHGELLLPIGSLSVAEPIKKSIDLWGGGLIMEGVRILKPELFAEICNFADQFQQGWINSRGVLHEIHRLLIKILTSFGLELSKIPPMEKTQLQSTILQLLAPIVLPKAFGVSSEAPKPKIILSTPKEPLLPWEKRSKELNQDDPDDLLSDPKPPRILH